MTYIYIYIYTFFYLLYWTLKPVKGTNIFDHRWRHGFGPGLQDTARVFEPHLIFWTWFQTIVVASSCFDFSDFLFPHKSSCSCFIMFVMFTAFEIVVISDEYGYNELPTNDLNDRYASFRNPLWSRIHIIRFGSATIICFPRGLRLQGIDAPKGCAVHPVFASATAI